MKKLKRLTISVLVILLMVVPVGCSETTDTDETTQKPIVLQGAMDVETELMMDALEDSE